MDYVRELISISKSDLKASRILMENGLFPQSYFSFQQAVEKANKSFGILGGAIDKDDLLDLGHNQIKIYKKAVDKQKQMLLEHQEIIKPFEHLTKHEFYKSIKFEEYLEKINKANRVYDSFGNYDLVNIDLEVVDYFILELTNIKNEKIREMEEGDKDVIMMHLNQYADFIGTFGSQEAADQKQQIINYSNSTDGQNEFTGMVYKIVKLVVDVAFINMTLYFFAILTERHVSRTRYIFGADKSPSELYNQNTPLNTRLPEMISLLESALIKLERLYITGKTQIEI
jgi:HEPN domain-containing protein